MMAVEAWKLEMQLSVGEKLVCTGMCCLDWRPPQRDGAALMQVQIFPSPVLETFSMHQSLN